MNLYFRLFWLLLTAKFRRKAHLLAETKVKGRIMPNDLDINMHVNNGRYLSLADLGRVDNLSKTGFLKIMMDNKWKPIIASVNARYFKGLKSMARIRTGESPVMLGCEVGLFRTPLRT